MANQYPQPEIFRVQMDYAASATAGTTVQVEVNTSQASNEEVRIYGLSVDAYDASATPAQTPITSTQWFDFDIGITVGANMVPSQRFDIGWISRTDEKTLMFAVPILKMFSQQLLINVTNVTAVPSSEDRDLRIYLHCDLVNQSVGTARDGGPLGRSNY